MKPVPGGNCDEHNVIFMGAAEVGKSSIISRYFRDKLTAEYTETVEEVYRENILFDKRIVTMNLLDTAGSYNFPAMRQLYIKKGDVFILVFSHENQDTFKEVEKLREEIIKLRDEAVPIVVVCNKTDLRKGGRTMEDLLCDTTVSCDWQNGYVECSALEDKNLQNIFVEALKRIYRDSKGEFKPPKVLRPLSKPRKSLVGLFRQNSAMSEKVPSLSPEDEEEKAHLKKTCALM